MIHEDERRILEDWPEAKIITAKKDCTLGGHYHKIKTEKFILVKGRARLDLENGGWEWLERGIMKTITPNEKHSFFLEKDSILIGLCSHPFDPTDDYK